MQMIIEFYTVNIFVKETFITRVGPKRAGSSLVKQRLGRAGLRNTWIVTGRAELQKMAQFRGLPATEVSYIILSDFSLHLLVSNYSIQIEIMVYKMHTYYQYIIFWFAITTICK
jgi:hypothetical protein